MPISPDDIDDLLTRHARDWKREFTAPPQPPVPTLIPRQARSRRLRWVTAAAAAAAVIVVAGAGVTLTNRHSPSASPADTPPPTVAWATSPAITPPSPTSSDTPQPTQIPQHPLCLTDDMAQPTLSETGGHGQGGYRLVVRYLGNSPRSLRPIFETGRLLDADHTVIGNGGHQTAEGFIGYLDLAPGQSITSSLGICGSEAKFVQLDLDNPARTHLQDAAIPTSAPDCTRGVRAGLSTYSNAVNANDSYRNLGVVIDAPTHATANSQIDYAITLTNGTDSTISLNDCPSYTEALVDPFHTPDSAGSSKSYRLNCTPTTQDVEPQQSVTFNMRLRAPQETGALALTWYWIGDPTSEDDHGYATAPRITVTTQ